MEKELINKVEEKMIKDFDIEHEENYANISLVNKNKNMTSTVELFDAIFQNNIEKLEKAIDNGADIHALRKDEKRDIGVVEYLVKYGVKDPEEWEKKEIEYNKKNGYLIKMLNILEKNGLSLLENKPLSGFGGNYTNHLSQVIIGRSLKEVSSNPEKWAEESCSTFGDSWIEHAINNGNNELVKSLISKENSKNIPWGLIESENGQSVLTMAIHSRDDNLIDNLLKDVTIDNVNKSLDDKKPWSMATELLSQVDNSSQSIVEKIKDVVLILVEKGADLERVRKEYNSTASDSLDDRKIASAIMMSIELNKIDLKPATSSKNSIKP